MSQSTAQNWGGKRPRSGRPAKGREQVKLMLPPEINQAVEKVAQATGSTKSDFVIGAIEKQLHKPMRRRAKQGEFGQLVYVELTQKQIAAIRREAKASDVTFDELVERAVANFLEQKKEK
jgi:hypothetical protein